MNWKAAMGARATGARLERVVSSKQWQEDRFVDVMPREEPKIWSTVGEMLRGGSSHRFPKQTPPIVLRSGADFVTAPQRGLRVTWLGHSTLLVELAGTRLLIDPVFGPRASPFSWAGPRRFHPPPLPLAELPQIDCVVISHDHYDHLDYPTILELARSAVPFITSLGVGAHLEHWGIAPERITELEWWESYTVKDVQVTATPARHFSGRLLTMKDRQHTLWSGFSIKSADHAVYFSGDTAMFPGFSDIGERLGPFDLAMIESGAYNLNWRDVHIGPEQAVLAASFLKAKCLLPVHWGTFDLALHGWTEPVERILRAAHLSKLKVTTPKPGESIDFSRELPTHRWWPELSWNNAITSPLISSGLPDDLVAKIIALGQSQKS